MKSSFISVFDETDFEFVDLLVKQGLSQNVAKTLTLLKGVPAATAQELEIGADMRQPEVSVAIRELKQYGWIHEAEQNGQGKGRPYKIYTLKVNVATIVEELEERKRLESKETLDSIMRLKELSKY